VHIQRVLMPVTGTESWTVIGDDGAVVAPVERYLAYLSALERSPNTVRAYAASLRLWLEFLGQAGVGWADAGVEDVARFVAWLRAPAENVIVLETGAGQRSAATVNRHLAAVFGFYDHHARSGVGVAAGLVAWRRVSRGSCKPFLHHVTKGRPCGITGPDGLVFLCVQEDEANIQHRTGAPSSGVTTGSPWLLRRQVLKDQGILGRYEIAERHLVKRKLPEERENPVVVNLRSAWQVNLLNFPAASLADRFADLPNQSLLGVVLEVRWDGERADRAHRYVLDPTILAHRFVRPFSDQDARIRNRPSLVNLFVQLLEDLLLGAVIHASRNVDVGDGHLCLLSWSLALLTW